MSNKFSFGNDPDNLQYIVSGIKDLAVTINNKFFDQSIVGTETITLIHNESYIIVECVAAISKDIAMLQSAAISAIPIYCKISSNKIHNLYGTFLVSYLSLENSEGAIPECTFKLQSSGIYEIK